MAIHGLQRQRRLGEGQCAEGRGFLRAILRATDWIYRNRAQAAEIAARELNIKPAYAERAWDYYTKTGTLTRDLAFTEAGLRKVSRRRSRPAVQDAKFDMSKYVDDRYLKRACATVKFDPSSRK